MGVGPSRCDALISLTEMKSGEPGPPVEMRLNLKGEARIYPTDLVGQAKGREIGAGRGCRGPGELLPGDDAAAADAPEVELAVAGAGNVAMDLGETEIAQVGADAEDVVERDDHAAAH